MTIFGQHRGDVLPADQQESATLPWKYLKIVRRDDIPIRSGLNIAIAIFVISMGLLLLWLASSLASWGWTLVLGVLFSYLMLTNYALMHEAIHQNLQSDLKHNYLLGVLTSTFFPVSFTLVQVTHQGHHYRNRSDAEIFDQYYPGVWSKVSTYCQWYGTLIGLFYVLVVLTTVLAAIIPGITKNKLLTSKSLGNGNLADITSRDLWRIRLEVILVVGFWSVMIWALPLEPLVVLTMFLMAGFNWSTRQYIAHAYSDRDVLDGAFNLKHNKLMSAVLLNGEWDLVHHRSPDVPWTSLPEFGEHNESRTSYIRHYFRMWGGPVPVTQPEPDIWNTEQMVNHLQQLKLQMNQATLLED
ncbi:MAG: fatty acid desaturase [Dehalococcoidia bacterium]|nr:fatty acid desaturase [Dehalococcoidia bacterium]